MVVKPSDIPLKTKKEKRAERIESLEAAIDATLMQKGREEKSIVVDLNFTPSYDTRRKVIMDYEKAGWDVTYMPPVYTDDVLESYFIFKRKKR